MAKRLYIVFHGRFPSEKAAALYAAEHAKSLAAHLPVTILVPRRIGARSLDARKHYQLPDAVEVVYLPTLDLFFSALQGIAFAASYAVFSCAVFAYLFLRLRKEDIVDTNEALPALLATLISDKVMYEVHDFPERFLRFYRLLFWRVRYILATNEWKKRQLQKYFSVPAEKIVMERNGVDLTVFAPTDRSEARRALGLLPDALAAVYTGHLYSWKGVETLAEAARSLPGIDVYCVGGTSEDVARFKEQYAGVANLHMMGHRPHAEMPLWLSAADVLVLPNTAREEISAHYTSPMKLFEYMASGRPIIASRLPSIEEVLPEEGGFFVPADDPEAMARAIQGVCSDPVEAARRTSRARIAVLGYAWDKRAERIADYFV